MLNYLYISQLQTTGDPTASANLYSAKFFPSLGVWNLTVRALADTRREQSVDEKARLTLEKAERGLVSWAFLHWLEKPCGKIDLIKIKILL